MIKSNASSPQKGSVTHHHDQSIIFMSFNTTKATPNKPRTPIPLLLEELCDILNLPEIQKLKAIKDCLTIASTSDSRFLRVGFALRLTLAGYTPVIFLSDPRYKLVAYAIPLSKLQCDYNISHSPVSESIPNGK